MTNLRCAGDANALLAISRKFTTKILYEILTKAAKTNDVVLDGWSEIKTSGKKGDSYASVLYRFTVYGTIIQNSEKIDVPVVVKGFPESRGRRKTFRYEDCFAAEINFYVNVWTKIRQFEEDKHVECTVIPQYYASLCDGENDFIVLEDLSVHGYANIDRTSCLDLQHAKIILELLANFHATSLAFKSQYPNEFKEMASSVKENLFTEQYRGWYKNYAESLYVTWGDALEKEIPGSIYEKKFKELIANDFFGQVIRLVEDKGNFAVVTQGDTWIPNILLKYNATTPVSAALIDFQFCRYSSPVIDLTIFIFFAINTKYRRENFDDILRMYHDQFTKRLVELGSDASLFTWEDFRKELRKYAKAGLSMCFDMIPCSILSDDEVADLNEMEGDEPLDLAEILNVKPVDTKEKRTILVNVIRDFIDNGLFLI